jgi:hypothetical protein
MLLVFYKIKIKTMEMQTPKPEQKTVKSQLTKITFVVVFVAVIAVGAVLLTGTNYFKGCVGSGCDMYGMSRIYEQGR